MQLLPNELALANLKGEISEDERRYPRKEEAYEWLKQFAGEDFGKDIARWAAWAKEKNKNVPSKLANYSSLDATPA